MAILTWTAARLPLFQKEAVHKVRQKLLLAEILKEGRIVWNHQSHCCGKLLRVLVRKVFEKYVPCPHHDEQFSSFPFMLGPAELNFAYVKDRSEIDVKVS